MSTERRNPKSVDIDLFPTERILKIINSEDATVASAVASAIPDIAKAVDEVRSAGAYSIEWNGTDWRGSHVASGVYVTRLESGSSSVTGKMVLLK